VPSPTSLFPDFVINQVYSSLIENNELPDWMGYYNIQFANKVYNETNLNVKSFPSDYNQILHKEKSLLFDNVELVARRLEVFDKVNMFEMAEADGISTLPFSMYFMEESQLGKYVPVSASEVINKNSISKVKMFSIQASLPAVDSDEVVCNIETNDFKSSVLDIYKPSLEENKNVTNLFLLMGSYLGNSLNPEKVLRNIYDSMLENDHFVILQGIYRPGSEKALLADYQNIVKYPGTYLCNKCLADSLDSKEALNVFWSDEGVPGVRISIKPRSQKKLGMVELDPNKELTIFRSNRFLEETLKNYFKNVGFKLIEINYDEGMDNALFILRK
jgi:hypothetical protein